MSDPWASAEQEAAELDRQEREIAATVTRQAAEWKVKWPHHCRACGGHGGSTFYQSHPYGMGSATETLFDPCDALPAGTCHRCGQVGLTEDDEGPCTKCGWNYDDGCPTL